MNRKVGRNDPCPCGSGKKYKRCHLPLDDRDRKVLSTSAGRPGTGTKVPSAKEPFRILSGMHLPLERTTRMFHDNPEALEAEFSRHAFHNELTQELGDFISSLWDRREVARMSTPAIVEKLGSMNIQFDAEDFKRKTQDYISACQLAEEHYYMQDYRASGLDEDFIWMAIIELWSRLVPERFNIEMLNDAMQDGYDDIEREDYHAGIDKWKKAWQMVKSLVPRDIRSVRAADECLTPKMTQAIENWCQDFAMELESAVLNEGDKESESFANCGITYCHDFCEVFPESEELIMVNMRRREAVFYAMLGDVKKADDLFSALAETIPRNPWVYVGWGDMYCHHEQYQNIPVNRQKAEEIYKLGLARCDTELDLIKSRLKDLGKHG